jgi:hypothetical protein
MAGGFGSNGDSKGGSAYPVTYGFGLLVLVALGVLFALRYFYGSIRVEGGTR